jgi:serine/threonine-protein kinase
MSTVASKTHDRPLPTGPAGHTLVCPRCGATATGRLGLRCPADAVAMCLLSEMPIKPASTTGGAVGGITGDPLLGRVVGGRYPVVGLLGRGGMGAVYRAVQEPLGRVVALKLIRPESLGPHPDGEETSPVRRRFFREAQAIAALSHPGIVGLYDYGEDPDGLIFMVMELIDGPTLRQALKSGGPLAVGRAVEITVQVLEALAHAHTVGVVHRDLKPGNIMLAQAGTPFERVKILDFGVAKVFAADAALHDITQGGSATALGTPRYMAPEQIINGPVSPRTDLYSVGILLYALLTGKPPFDGPSGYHIFRQHQEAEVPPLPAELGVPAGVERAVRWALEKDPEQRPADALTLAAALRAACPVVMASPAVTLPPMAPSEARPKRSTEVDAPVPVPEPAVVPPPVPSAAPPPLSAAPPPPPPPPPLQASDERPPVRRAPAFALALTQPSARAPVPLPESDDGTDETSGHGESPMPVRPEVGPRRAARAWPLVAGGLVALGVLLALWRATDAPPGAPPAAGVTAAGVAGSGPAGAPPRPAPESAAPVVPVAPLANSGSAPATVPASAAASAPASAAAAPAPPPTRGPVAAPRPPAPRSAAPKGPKVKVQRL